MNGMRKIAQIKGRKILDEEADNDELDFDQEIEETVEKTAKAENHEGTHATNLLLQGKEAIVHENHENKHKVSEIVCANGTIPSKVENSNVEAVLQPGIDLTDPEVLRGQQVPSIEKINSEVKNLPLNLNEEILLNLKTPADLELLEADMADNISRESLDTENDRSIYVKNVDFSAVPEDLEEHFKSCGDISRITILVDKYTGLPKGYAFVEFTSMEGKENAKELNDSILKGRQIKVEDKRKNIPDYFGKKTKHFNRPVFTNDNYMRGTKSHFGPLKGKFMSKRHFQPY